MTRPTETDHAAHTNALIRETSPYLLQHAHNPVDWLPWGETAFERARRQNKPIFLSVGYATCYWCHVMERQVFEDARIAERMNAHCVNVKVDREERPDVDEIYMTATQLMTQHGGWPMSVFLTPPGAGADDDPGLKPFWAGTYIPPEPMHGMPSFPQLVEGVADAWRNRRAEIIEQADRVAEAVREHLRHRDTSGPLSPEMVEQAVKALMHQYDAQHGGFGGAPKFPQPAIVQLLFDQWRTTEDDALRQALTHTLDRMARGGIYDQVGGGFHRYSTDAHWLVPHFEKMLYDNGQLLELYAQAADDKRLTRGNDARFARAVAETAEYLRREMTDAIGAFWSAQDAEVDGYEGANYLWTRQQIEQAIDDPDLAQLAVRMYGLEKGTNFKDPHQPDAEPANVLHMPRPIHELAAELGEDTAALERKRDRINAQLKQVRDRRAQPRTDDKLIVEWNGMAIAGLAAASFAQGNHQPWLDAARRAADAIVEHMTAPDGGLYRIWRDGEAKVPAFLSDYAFFIRGLIRLHNGGAGDHYLALARQYADTAIGRFTAATGGYYDTLAEQADLFVRVRSAHDGVIPSGNSQMIHNLIDLHHLTGDHHYFERAVADLGSFGQLLESRGAAMPHMIAALRRAFTADPKRVEAAAARFAVPKQPPQRGPVSVSVSPERLDVSRGQTAVTVTLVIAPGHHLHAADPGAPEAARTELLLRGAPGLSLAVHYPAGKSRELPYAVEPLHVYAGEVTLHAQVQRVDGASLGEAPRLVLRFQPCTDRQCLPPQTIELPLEIIESDR